MLGTKAVVIDNGSGWMKAGFAGDDVPRLIFPSVVGRPRHHGTSNPAMGILVGDEALAKRGLLTLRYPIDQGRIVDWDAMEHLWRHAFTALGVSPGNQPLLITQFSLWSAEDVDRLIGIMFGTFGVPAIYVGGEVALTLLALGTHTGAMISIGDFQSRAGLKNISDRAIAGPLHILFAGVPDMVHLQSFSGAARTDVAGRPYVTVPDTTSLAPGQSAVIRFQLSKNASPITHAALTTEICIGGFD